MRQAQDGDPDDPFTKALRSTYNDLDAERLAALSAVAQLDAADGAAPLRPETADVDLLDALPYLTGNLTDAPETLLRRLFEATSLTIRLTDDGDHVVITIRLPGDTLPEIIGAVETINESNEAPGQTDPGACVDAVCAPGGSTKGWDLVRPADMSGRLVIEAGFDLSPSDWRGVG
jgi:hypothetical protein